MNISTRTTVVSNVQLDDNIRIWLLEEEGFKSASETWNCRRRNNVFGQSIPDPRSRNVEGPTTDCRQSEHLHHQATGAGRAECPPTMQICYSVEWSKVPLCFMLFSSSAWTQFTRFHCHKTFSEIL